MFRNPSKNGFINESDLQWLNLFKHDQYINGSVMFLVIFSKELPSQVPDVHKPKQ